MFLLFFFKQKTAYEMRISDWSSDVCSSDLAAQISHRHVTRFLLDLAGENAVARRLRRVLAPGNVTGEPCLDVVDGEICQTLVELAVCLELLLLRQGREGGQLLALVDQASGNPPAIGGLEGLFGLLGRHQAGFQGGHQVLETAAQRLAPHRLPAAPQVDALLQRSEEHTSELQSLMRISYAVFCLKKKQQATPYKV